MTIIRQEIIDSTNRLRIKLQELDSHFTGHDADLTNLKIMEKPFFYDGALAEMYSQVIFDRVRYFDLCVKHDHIFQGIETPSNLNNLKENLESFTISDKVKKSRELIAVHWTFLAEMLYRSHFRDNVCKMYKRIKKRELNEYLDTSKDYRNACIYLFQRSLLVSLIYEIKNFEKSSKLNMNDEDYIDECLKNYFDIVKLAVDHNNQRDYARTDRKTLQEAVDLRSIFNEAVEYLYES